MIDFFMLVSVLIFCSTITFRPYFRLHDRGNEPVTHSCLKECLKLCPICQHIVYLMSNYGTHYFDYQCIIEKEMA